MLKKKSISKFFYNDKFLAVFSLFVAFIVWAVVAVEITPEVTMTLKIPVTVDESVPNKKYNVYSFSEEEIFADVVVTGQRYIIDDIKESITVTADASSVTKSGDYNLKLSADSDDSRTVSIALEQETVEVSFDIKAEETFTVKINIENEDEVDDGYYLDEAFISNNQCKEITVEGPKKEVSKVNGVKANIDISNDDGSPVTETVSKKVWLELDASNDIDTTFIKMLKSNGTELEDNVEIQIPVYKIEECSAKIKFTGDYNYSKFEYTVSPAKIKVGASEGFSKSEIVIDTIDYSELSPGENTFTVKAEDIDQSGFVIIDKDIKEFTVKVSTPSDFTEKIIILNDDNEFKYDDEKYDLTINGVNFTDCIVIGSKEYYPEFASSNASFILLTDSLGDDPKKGEHEVPVKLDSEYFWLNPDDIYTVAVTVK